MPKGRSRISCSYLTNRRWTVDNARVALADMGYRCAWARRSPRARAHGGAALARREVAGPRHPRRTVRGRQARARVTLGAASLRGRLSSHGPLAARPEPDRWEGFGGSRNHPLAAPGRPERGHGRLWRISKPSPRRHFGPPERGRGEALKDLETDSPAASSAAPCPVHRILFRRRAARIDGDLWPGSWRRPGSPGEVAGMVSRILEPSPVAMMAYLTVLGERPSLVQV